MKIQKKLLIIAILSLCFQIVKSEVKFNLYGLCSCNQLLYESECKFYPHCEFLDQTCKQKTCEQLITLNDCTFNFNCAWLDGKCQDFKSCSEYGIVDETKCNELNLTCKYNPFTSKCENYKKAFPKTCAKTPSNQCYVGSDGVCTFTDGVCKKLDSCNDVDYTDKSCLQASPACFPNVETEKCETQIGCQNAQINDCKQAIDGIGSYNYYLCQKDSKGQCEDLDLTIQTQETCQENSLGFYHWNGQACEICQQIKFAYLITSFMSAIIY